MYEVIWAPPSDLGGAHLRSAWCLFQSLTSGLPGLSGSPVNYYFKWLTEHYTYVYQNLSRKCLIYYLIMKLCHCITTYVIEPSKLNYSEFIISFCLTYFNPSIIMKDTKIAQLCKIIHIVHQKQIVFSYSLKVLCVWIRKLKSWETGEVYTRFWQGNLRERDHLEDQDIDGRIILSWIFRKWDLGEWTRSIWLRIWTGRKSSNIWEQSFWKQLGAD